LSLKLDKLKENSSVLTLSIIIPAIFLTWLFGVTGLRIVLGSIFVTIPFYLILNNFGFKEGEKYVFSWLLGISLFPAFVYLISLLLSFTLSLIATFVLLILVSLLIDKMKSEK
jgi:hypothetical protein